MTTETRTPERAAQPRGTLETNSDEMRAFARVLKAALVMIVRYLEHRYHV